MASTVTDQINGVSSSTAIKAPVRCATTENITLSGFQTVDGVVLASGDENLRVLVKDQTTTTENGIYDVNSNAWTRAADFDGNRDVKKGTLIPVNEGTVNARTLWRCTAADPVVIDTSNITFEAAGTLTADATNIAAAISGSSETTTPADANLFGIIVSGVLNKVSWANIKATLKTYLDTLYQPLAAVLTNTTASFTTAQQTKLSGIETGAQVNDPTDLSNTPGGTSVIIHSSTGGDTTIGAANFGDGDAGVITAADQGKLGNVGRIIRYDTKYCEIRTIRKYGYIAFS